MADIPLDPGQASALAQETLHSVAGLSPAAQVAAVGGVCIVVGLWVWTRRPKEDDTLRAVIGALAEQSASMNLISERVEQVIELNSTILAQNAALIAEIAECRGVPAHRRSAALAARV